MKNSFINPPYGYDAPEIVKKFILYGAFALLMVLIFILWLPKNWVSVIAISIMLLLTICLVLPAIAILIGSLRFKFRERDWLFSHIRINGDENILDVGCGHGLLLINAAKQLTTGKAHGLDLWVQADQLCNSKEATLENAKTEGVSDRIEVHSGDMQEMPFADAIMDIVISSWAIHNIYDKNGREKALTEIIRVLKPGGQIAILDIDHAPDYKVFFVKNGLHDVQLLGPRYTFGNKTYLVLAKKI